MQLLQVKHLHKVYGKGNNEVKAVKNVSFSVEKGEFITIMDLLVVESQPCCI